MKEFKNLKREVEASKERAVEEGDGFRLHQLQNIEMSDPNEDEQNYKEERDTYQRETNMYPSEGLAA